MGQTLRVGANIQRRSKWFFDEKFVEKVAEWKTDWEKKISEFLWNLKNQKTLHLTKQDPSTE